MTLNQEGAQYLNKTERRERKIMANFRMYRFESENKRENGNGQICCV